MTWAGVTDAAKGVAAALGGLAILGYITGYLVLRARAHALGIAPPFDLVDEIYVFAGVRFLIWLLVLVALTAPLVAAIVAAAGWLAGRLRRSVIPPLAWAGVTMLALAVVVLLADVLAIRDLLFVVDGTTVAGDPAGPPAYLDPRDAGYGVRVLGLELLAVALAALAAIWLARSAVPARGRATALAVILTLQVFQLPTLHGALRADRIVPVLWVLPASARGLEGTALIVDRNSSVATLFGKTGAGQPALVTIPADDLHGLPQGRPVALFAPQTGLQPAGMAAARASHTPMPHLIPASADVAADEPGFLAAVAGRLGRMLDNLGALSDNAGLAGRVFEARLAPDGTRIGTAPRGPAGIDLSWPVIAEGGAIYALRSEALVRVEPDAAPVLDARLRWRKLIGVLPDGGVVGLADVDGTPSGVVFDPDSEITTVPLSPAAFATLLAETFVHASGDVLEVNRSARGGRGLDVYLIRDGSRRDISGCGNDRCVQPAMAPQRTRVLYVRASPG